MDYAKISTIDPARRRGKACIRSTRITDYDVLGYLASGITQEQILADFPELSEIDFRPLLGLFSGRRAQAVRRGINSRYLENGDNDQ